MTVIKNKYYLVQRMSGFSFYSALIKVAWGIVLLSPDNTFAANPRSYTNMTAIATEQQWGIFLLIAGIIHLSAIFTYNLKFRIITQIASVGIWLFIAAQFWLSNPIGTGKITYALAAMIDFIVIIYILKYKGGRYE